MRRGKWAAMPLDEFGETGDYEIEMHYFGETLKCRYTDPETRAPVAIWPESDNYYLSLAVFYLLLKYHFPNVTVGRVAEL